MFPLNGTWNIHEAANRIMLTWMIPINIYGSIFPLMTSSGVVGIAREIFHGPALSLPRDRQPGHQNECHGQNDANQPWHYEVLSQTFRVVEVMDTHIEGLLPTGQRRKGAQQVLAGDRLRQIQRRRDGIASRGRICSVGLQ